MLVNYAGNFYAGFFEEIASSHLDEPPLHFAVRRRAGRSATTSLHALKAAVNTAWFVHLDCAHRAGRPMLGADRSGAARSSRQQRG